MQILIALKKKHSKFRSFYTIKIQNLSVFFFFMMKCCEIYVIYSIFADYHRHTSFIELNALLTTTFDL